MKIKTFTTALAAILSAFAAAAAALTPKAVLENGGATLRLVYDSRDYGTEDADWFPVRDGKLNLGDGDSSAVLYGHMRELDAYIYVYSITNIVVDPSFAAYRPPRAFGWFAGFPELVRVDGLENFRTSAITDFSRMFYRCEKLERLDLSTFDTSAAVQMDRMFYSCRRVKTLDLTGFDTSRVTSVGYMFYECSGLTTIYATRAFTVDHLSDSSSSAVFNGCWNLVGGAGMTHSSGRYDLKFARLDRPDAPGYFSQKPGGVHDYLFVDGATGSDANEGHRSDCAKATIQAAADAVSADGDVYVAAGTYAPFAAPTGKSVTVKGRGACATAIDGGDCAPCATLGTSTLTGFTLRRGRAESASQGAAASGGTVLNCIIRDCTGSVAGAASGCLGSVVENTLCHGNTCASGTGGVLVDSTVRNCTVADNVGYGLWNGTSVNTISWNNRFGGRATDASLASLTNASARTYCLFTESAGVGEGNQVGNPGFADAAGGDYRLAAGSPCIDAGSNAQAPGTCDMDGHARVINGTVDIGCYERADYLRALDVTFDAVFNGGAETDWQIVTDESSCGGTSVRTAPIGNSEETSVSLTVTGTGVLSFDWKVDCETYYDYLVCCVDGVDRKIISGASDWTTVRLYLEDAGVHEIVWRYQKDSSVSTGADCVWIDHVTWEPGAENPTPGLYTEVVNGNEWTYRIVDGYASLGGDSPDLPALNNPHSGTVELPYDLGGYRIGRIGDYAFYNGTWLDGFSHWSCSCLDDLTEIGAHAFEGCTSLRRFKIPDNVTAIGEAAFRGCARLTSLALPTSVVRCGTDVVSDCTQLRDLLVQSPLENVLSFSGCPNLQTIRYTGDASLPSGSYGGVSSSTTLYVKSDSEGWGCAIPGTWCGISIDTFENLTARQREALDFTGEGVLASLDTYLWAVTEDAAAEGGTALRISDVRAYDTSALSLTVEGRGTLTFRWKVASSSSSDGLRCVIDGVEYDRITGSTGWTEVVAEIKGEGAHEIRWECADDSSEGWLDCVAWTPGARELKPGTDVLLWAPSVSSDAEVSGAVTKILNVLKEAYGTRIPARAEYADSYPEGITVKVRKGSHYSPANLTGNLDGYGLVFVLFPKSGIPAAQVERLKTVVARGARVVLQGEHASWSPDENAVLTQLAKDMGADFAILDGAKAGTDVYNAASDLLKDPLSGYPDSKSVAPIGYSGVAQDVAHLSEDASFVWAVDEASGNGRVTAISDISWYCDTGTASGTLYDEAIPFLERLLANAIENEKKVIDGEDPNADVEEKVPDWAVAAVRDNNGLLTYYSNVVSACSAASDGFAVTNRLTVALKRDVNESFLLPEGVTFETIGITAEYAGTISVPTGCELVVNAAGDVFKSVGVRPPESPVVTASDGTFTNRVEIGWHVPASVKPILGYEVKRAKVGSTLETVLVSSTTNTTYVDTTARVGVHYIYSVRAQSAAGWGFAGTDEGWCNATGFAPDPVLAVTATDGTSSNEVVVTWIPDTNSAISVTHYEVRRAPKGTDAWTVLASDIDPSVTRFADATARPGIDYDYQVRVGNADGWSAAAGDTGWRAISLSLDETSWSPSAGATNKAVAVTSNADWAISDATGEASVTATAAGLDVSLAENESTDGRTGTVTVTAGGGTDHPVRETFTYAQAGRPIPIPVAVDAEDWIFETGASAGGAAWFGQPKVSHDGVDAARSGRLTGAGATWFETTVTNAGDIAFFWKTSCEPTYDGLSFSVDGETRARLSGVADGWRQLSFEIPAGTHVLRWTYSKDGKNDAGEDCGWVDQVTWTPLAAPAWDATDAEGAVRASDGFTVTNRLTVALKRDVNESFLLPEGVTFETIGITAEYAGTISVPTGCELVVNAAGDVFKSVGVRPPESPVVTASDGTFTNRVEIGWHVPASVKPILGYEVKRAKVGSTLETVLVSSTTNTTYVDTTARVGVHYIYSVRAQSAAGWGFAGTDEGWCNATGFAPDPVLAVTATDGTSSNEVVVTWIPDTNSAISVTHYEVRRAPKGTDAWTVLASDIDPSVTRFADATARPGIDYDYQVRVGNADGWSAAAGDTGWRAISLSLDETSWAPSSGATNKAVAVTSNADWTISDATGEAAVTATAAGLDVSLAENESTDGRTGTVTVTAGGGTDHPVRETFTYVQAGRPIPLPVAVDAEDWIFETGASAGGAAWFGQPKVSHDGVDAARSGRLTGAGATWFETTVTNAGDIAFFWKTSCEPTYDGLSFSVDGETRARLSGVADGWRQLSFEIPAGTHVLRWTYSKDGKNDAGEDCGWVDQVTWTPLAAPAWDATDAEGAVRASDGTSADHVSVTWSPFASGRPVVEYELSRAEKGSAAWEVLTTANVLSFVDATARPGVDYTYRVRARNAAGWSAPAADDGWRAYALAVGAADLAFSSSAGAADLAVTANASWTVAADADWIAVAAASGAAGDADAATVSVTANEAMTARAGAVTVTVGTGAHAVSAEVRVVQSARPPQIDVGFVTPFEDWRTRLQVVTNTTAGDVYAPVSVLLAGDPMSVSFGWTNRSEVAVGVPDVLFKVLDAEGVCVSEWTAKGRPGETLAVGASTWSSGWPFGVLRVLQPGDYLLRAELAPAPTYADVDRSDNVAVFRFAVRDPSVTLADDVFADPQWRDPAAKAGNDFAQPPHAAAADCLQFGPYVPMNGLVGRSSNGKQPLDLIFLVDVTGSMGGCIDALKRNIRQFFDALVTGEDRVTDWRAKVVAYRDITCDSPWYQDWGFTTDPDAMRDEIARCYASGGGDTPESLLDAVYRISTETDFREGAARAVLAFTDATYKSPMSYGAAAGAGWEKAAQVARDAEVVLKLIASPWYGEGESELRTFAESCFSTNSEYIGVSSLSSAALNEDMLRQLAKSVSKSVKTTVVEPSLSVSTRGKGTLSFEWKNDSTAGTNNVFRFSCDDGEGHTNLVNAAGTDWQRVSLDLETGWHLFKWSYGKTDYDGAIVDCGKVRNLAWTPYQTELSLAPTFTEVGHEGARDAENLADGRAVPAVGDGNRKVTVTCNAAWKVVDETVPDWITVVAGAGDGNGEIWYQVATNALHVSRAATITVRAGDYGLETDLILEKTFKVSQKASPYVENGAIQILTVDVKPRWPWNDVIDIDFRVLTPAKEGTPVKVSLVGVNEEGGEMLQYYPALKNACEVKPKTRNLSSPHGLEVGADYVICPTSGLYRVTWTDMAKNWYSTHASIGGYAGWKQNGFHTPAFSVRLTGSCDGVASVELPSDPVRVDMRQNAVSGTSTHSTTERSGGAILTGTERIGHPTGAVDPVAVDTTDAALFPSNGWNRLDGLVRNLGPALYSNRFDRACVINDAAVEGGLIVTDTVWRADRVHVVRDNVFVHKDATLTIEDGAVVKFCFNTYLFIYKHPDRTGVEEFNLRMKGCYLTCGYDGSYGGNTLYYDVKGKTSDTQEKWNGLSAVPILSNASSGANLLPQVASSEARAATRVSLQCKVDGKWTTWKDRFYSRGQRWGVLPRPSEDGLAFYGWYCGDPATWLTTDLLASRYPVSKAFMISADGTPFDTETYGVGTTFTKVTTHFRDGQIFALMCSPDWAESAWDLVDASGAQVVLADASVVYDGQAHRPSVARVLVNDVLIDPANYEVTYPKGDCTAVGDYAVSVSFLSDYTGTPSTTFRILPRPTDGGAVVTEPASRMYLPAALGGSAKPTVSVTIPGMASVPSGDYAVTWPDAEGRWPRIGVYTVVATFNGNYTGPALTNTFEITVNPDYVYTEYGTKEEAVAKADGRRILYIGGREGDAMTRHVKDLIRNDTDLNEWVIANFSCWADAVESVADLKFADGLATVEMPLLAVLGERDDTDFVARHAGYFADAAELKAFLAAALEAEEVVDASAADVTLARTSAAWTGRVQKPTVTSVTLRGETLAEGTDYTVVYGEGDWTAVGAYAVKVAFCGAYRGETAARTFEIVPAALEADAVALDPASAAYDGTAKRPSVTSVAGVDFAVDYGTGGYVEVGDYDVRVTATGCVTGTVSKTFSVTAQPVGVGEAVEIVLDVTGAEIRRGKTPAEPLRPNVLAVRQGGKTFVAGVDYDVDYGDGDYLSAGTNTITVTFKGRYSGTASVTFEIVETFDAVVTVEGDEGAEVIADPSDPDRTLVRPSEGNTSVVVVIPEGVDAAKVTVEVSTAVVRVTPNGATVRIVSGGTDITGLLVLPEADAEGRIDLTAARVVDAVVREVLNPGVSADNVVRWEDGRLFLQTVTRRGLRYVLYEGERLDALRAGDSTTGDGSPWRPRLSVYGGTSGFYSIRVGK